MGNGSKSITSYRDLIAWQRAFDFALNVYRLTASFPSEERFGLTSQLRRSAMSVSCNIAEGYGRGSRIDYARFLRVARGSLFEAETQLLFALRLGYAKPEAMTAVTSQLNDTARVLSGLIQKLQPPRPTPPTS